MRRCSREGCSGSRSARAASSSTCRCSSGTSGGRSEHRGRTPPGSTSSSTASWPVPQPGSSGHESAENPRTPTWRGTQQRPSRSRSSTEDRQMLPVSSAKRRSRKRPPLWRQRTVPRPGKTGLRRLAVAAAALAAAVVLAPAAMADESAMPTTQATAYNADWVPYLDPPAKPAAVCLVDSGVNITPDTPPDSPEGPIVKRLALDGGSGLAANSTWEGLHGTRMAFVGAAPVNGWGAVGFWPGARIVSIRAMPTDETDFPFENYSRALVLCTKNAASLNIVAINLSLGCECQAYGDDLTRLDDQITRAHANDESVVGAAGNNGGAVASPANASGVFAVAAQGPTGLCDFSNRG